MILSVVVCGYLVNNQFEMPSREAVVAYVQINNCICLKRLGKTTRDLSGQMISRP